MRRIVWPITRGDTSSLILHTYEAPSIKADVYTLTIRRHADDEVLILHAGTLNSGGESRITLSHSETKKLDDGSYVFDLQASGSYGTKTWINGIVEVSLDVSH